MEQTPGHLDTACLLQAIEPPVSAGEPFRYCELGCGVGETALAIAAANPRSDVWGFDFNPAHIARGKNLARKGGLANINLVEASFEDLARSDRNEYGLFDYIALHGVWSWVSPANRTHIVRFIDRHLKPGGLVYITYNALPGWTSAMPVQRLLRMFAQAAHDRSDRTVVRALDSVRTYAEAGSTYVPADLLERLDKERDGGKLSYLSHEYLNAHWAPCYQVDVARDLGEAKLSYIGSATLLENYPDLCLTAQQRELLASTPAAFAETAKDFLMIRPFHRDVFVRGARRIPERRLDERIRQTRLALVVPQSAVTRDIKIPLGEATLNESFYAPALEALADVPRTVGELMDLAQADRSTVSPREVLGMLVGSRQALTLPNEVDASAIGTVRRYNVAHLKACADEARAISALAALGIGSAITVRLFEMLAYEAIAGGTEVDPASLTEATWEMLKARGDKITNEGKIVEDPAENLKIIRENMEAVVSAAVPIWRRVGAI
ncbi:methyltransferase regulatory domain-containing protein [Nitratireductor sp. GCM10026969]